MLRKLQKQVNICDDKYKNSEETFNSYLFFDWPYR